MTALASRGGLVQAATAYQARTEDERPATPAKPSVPNSRAVVSVRSPVLLMSVPFLEPSTPTAPVAAAAAVVAAAAVAVVLPPPGLATKSRQEAGVLTPSSSNDEWRPTVPAAVLVPNLTMVAQVVAVSLPRMSCWSAAGAATLRTGPNTEAKWNTRRFYLCRHCFRPFSQQEKSSQMWCAISCSRASCPAASLSVAPPLLLRLTLPALSMVLLLARRVLAPPGRAALAYSSPCRPGLSLLCLSLRH